MIFAAGVGAVVNGPKIPVIFQQSVYSPIVSVKYITSSITNDLPSVWTY